MTSTDEQKENQIGRNEPCTCGSGKKYKRCCGKDAAPKLSSPKTPDAPLMIGPNGLPIEPPQGGNMNQGMPGGMDPSKMNPAMMAEMQKELSKLPKDQMKKLRGIAMKAMIGRDVTKDVMALEGSLPPSFLAMFKKYEKDFEKMAPKQEEKKIDINDELAALEEKKTIGDKIKGFFKK